MVLSNNSLSKLKKKKKKENELISNDLEKIEQKWITSEENQKKKK